MSDPTPIAERALDLLHPSGHRYSFRVEFGPTYQHGHGFRCRVRFHGWEDSPPDIGGYDSLHALILAVDLVHSILKGFVQQGGRVLWPGTDKDYDLDAFEIPKETSSA